MKKDIEYFKDLIKKRREEKIEKAHKAILKDKLKEKKKELFELKKARFAYRYIHKSQKHEFLIQKAIFEKQENIDVLMTRLGNFSR